MPKQRYWKHLDTVPEEEILRNVRSDVRKLALRRW